MSAPELIVMAAGIGSRYGGLKQIDPIGPGGESILDYSLYDAIQAGFRSIIFVVSGAMEDALRQRVERRLCPKAAPSAPDPRLRDELETRG